ncbi:Histone-lysine N-methyltransferase ash1 [Penicillium rolfsii]|nr:Histone-lysine N-methyltransferase ash1 [Penicillium rolfsii]
MARRNSQVSASATSAIADLPTNHQHDDTMSLDVPEQLLTPENSHSETSSNNENALVEEKSVPRRRSTRVARASLQAAETLEATPVENEDAAASTSQAYVDSLAQAKRTRSSARHSIAVMESSLLKGTLPEDDAIMTDSHPMAPDTPVSKSSQELQVEDMATSLQQRTLRKRVEKALADVTATPKAKATPKNDSRSSVRRSTRLSIVDKASDLLDRANSILGKRSRDLNEKGKEVGRRASLRLRTVATVKEDVPAPAPEPAAKKRRVSESDLSKLREEEAKAPSEEPAAPAPPPRYKPKRWLTHGLYTGQEPSDSPPKQRRSKNSAKATTGPSQRRLLPMPMFTGARIVSNGRDYVLPFDIFSPLPPGQPKPDEWRKTNKNVFVGDAASEWKANKKLELSTCMCEEETGCDENCQNRYMFYECDSGNCRLGPECGNRNFNELKHRTKAGGKYNIGVEVIKTADRGYGVRSNRTFEPNQIIVEYTGEIITQFECERRMRTVYKNNECYYLMYFDQNMIIDATRGSIARFVNHSCEPNCRMEKWTVAGKPRMALFAGDRGIMTGEELSYDYNFDPYSNKNVQQCRCGSENCRGILGPRPKDKDQRAKLEEKAQAAEKGSKKVIGKKRKLADAGSTTSQKGKKRKLLNPKSIKAGVKRVVAKATARRKAAAKKTTKASATSNRGKAAKEVKLPKVKAASRVKAAVRNGPRPKTKTSKAAAASSVKGTSVLKRPSLETKKKILARAQGTGRSSPKKSPVKAKNTGVKSSRKSAERKAPSKSPVKARMPVSKPRMSSTTSGPKVKKTLAGSVKRVAKGVVRTVRGKKN